MYIHKWQKFKKNRRSKSRSRSMQICTGQQRIMLVWVTYMIWDLTWYFRIWLFSYIFGEFWLLLLLIRLSRTILKYAQYYFQFTFSSFESVMCPSKVSKLRFMLDFKCFSPRNSMPNLISFGLTQERWRHLSNEYVSWAGCLLDLGCRRSCCRCVCETQPLSHVSLRFFHSFFSLALLLHQSSQVYHRKCDHALCRPKVPTHFGGNLSLLVQYRWLLKFWV